MLGLREQSGKYIQEVGFKLVLERGLLQIVREERVFLVWTTAGKKKHDGRNLNSSLGDRALIDMAGIARPQGD